MRHVNVRDNVFIADVLGSGVRMTVNSLFWHKSRSSEYLDEEEVPPVIYGSDTEACGFIKASDVAHGTWRLCPVQYGQTCRLSAGDFYDDF